jgi:hypothetical protein
MDIPDDDETHPIPHLGKIDVAVELKNGGYYAIVLTKPLVNDLVTRQRLLRKLDNYLSDFHSQGFKDQNGAPLEGKLRIFVSLHPDTEAGIIDFLNSCRPWLAENKVDLHIRKPPMPTTQ